MSLQCTDYALGVYRGDLGRSIWSRRPVSEIMVDSIGVTIELGLMALLPGSVSGIVIGTISAVLQNQWPDYLLRSLSILGLSIPSSAVAVDLLGEIAGEDRFDDNMINGTGGQPDAHSSAALCKSGRAATVLRSTALEGSLSEIVARHEAGAFVTIPSYLEETIITEQGVARPLGKNHRQRVGEMIGIANPDFRAELRREARTLVGEP